MAKHKTAPNRWTVKFDNPDDVSRLEHEAKLRGGLCMASLIRMLTVEGLALASRQRALAEIK